MFADNMSTIIIIVSAAAVLFAIATDAVTQHPLVVVVSFDGFRPEYMHPDITPTMVRFRNESAAPPYMRPVFPTKTFVNHFSMATGLYSETHGVLDNYMFDRNHNKMHYTYEQFHYDESVVPIWMQNEYSGDGRHSGVMMWPGSEFPYQNKTPTHIQKYNRSMPWTSRVDKIISWIKDEKQPANLVFAYFEEPDSTAHLKGIESQDTKNQIVRVDTTVKYISQQIKYENLEKKLNLIILSDHGMETVTYNKLIFLDEYVSNNTYEIVNSGPNAFILPNSGKFDEVYNNLTKGSIISGNFDLYKKDQIPERWHMKNTSRLNGILYLLAKPGFAFWNNFFQLILNKTTKDNFRAGVHGYDNNDPGMRALFMASGPVFKKNFIAQPFDNIDLYPLISQILDLQQSNNLPNGTMEGVQQLLSCENSAASSLSPPGIQGVLVALLLRAIARRL